MNENSSMKGFWCLSLCINLFLLYSIFDIYFKSPITKVSRSYKTQFNDTGIDRIVFFVADGLRADTFQDQELRPFLTEQISGKNAVFGISETRVPTESRPGHIALFAGFYEDPSAVFTGWKDNVVEFDSVFNRTAQSLAIGSPDVVDMFAKGLAKEKMETFTYPSDWQDFSAENSSLLDTWVLEKFQDCAERHKLPEKQGSLIFLHLLGIDNTGHSQKPPSNYYRDNFKLVDGICKAVSEQIYKYYGDNRTLFIFTSDHGMTDWGSHGSGSLEETETPFVIWGPIVKSSSNPLRIKQADFTAILAAALGHDFPTNSVGHFPVGIWLDEEFQVEALKANVLQIEELMLTKKKKVFEERNFNVIPAEEEKLKEQLGSMKPSLVSFLNQTSYLKESLLLVTKANIYYERYDQSALLSFAAAAFILWIFLLATSVLYTVEFNVFPGHLFHPSHIFILIAILSGSVVCKGLIGWSLWKVPYCIIPVLILLLLYKGILQLQSSSRCSVSLSSVVVLAAMCIIGIELLVNTFFERRVLSLGLILNSLGILLYQRLLLKESTCSCNARSLSSATVSALAVFPIVPVSYAHKLNMILGSVGPLCSSALLLIISLHGNRRNREPAVSKKFIGIQSITLLSTIVLLRFPENFVTRVISWTSLFLSMVLPTVLVPAKSMVLRITGIYACLSVPFHLMSLSFESLFLPVLFLSLLSLFKALTEFNGRKLSWGAFFALQDERSGKISWPNPSPHVEFESKSTVKKKLFEAALTAWFHLFFTFLSFFGTGNIASVSTFNPTSVRCFVSVFQPWIMMVLLLMKILIPFLLVSCFFKVILRDGLKAKENFLILSLYSQIMGLHMYFLVTNEGSWLQIGSSISHFVIVQLVTLFSLFLHMLANYLVLNDFRFLRYSALTSRNLNTRKFV